MDQNRQSKSRVVIQTPPGGYPRGERYAGPTNRPRTGELTVAISVIAAAALATFAALFLTSRPYDPMNSTVGPQQTIPPGPVVTQPSPKQSPSSSPQSAP